jgi:hypothetical protein
MDQVARLIESDSLRKLERYTAKRFRGYYKNNSSFSVRRLNRYLGEVEALMKGVEGICFGEQEVTLVLSNAKRDNQMFLEKEKRSLELCPDQPWFIHHDDVTVCTSDAWTCGGPPRAIFRRRDLHLFVNNLFSFHGLLYEEKLGKDALYFLRACIE